MMFNRLKKMLAGSAKAAPKQKEHDISLAVTAMMISIMNIDDKLESAEHQEIIKAVQKRFKLTSQEVNALIDDAKIAHDKATDFHQFTSLISQHFSTEERISFLKDLWQVAMADGHIDPYEEQLIRRVANLVGVYHGEFIQAKIDARESTSPH